MIASLIGVLLGAVIMVVGYSLGRAFIYATPAAAIAKLPYQILQALVGAALGMVLRWKVKPARKARREARRDGGIKVVFS